ncbi:efflux RND transporter periplasmic adaptor subunit [Peribacillus asahii]|uniref:efflux RND transporter periplasmic adaptor subunit n=1 Tax=Peribacillus asahii TaxID=228899 RepID=UPI00381647C7
MRNKWPLLSTAICLTLVTSACSSKPTSGVETERTAISVEVVSAKNESLDAISSLTGTLAPYEETTVSFEVGGNVKNMDVEIGDTIQSGTVLTSLKASDYELQVKQADNAILQAKAALTSSDSAINAAGVGVDAAGVGVSSADAGISAADAGIGSSDEAIKSAQANIKAANARINSAQASLDAVNKGAREQEKAQARTAVNRAEDAYNKLKKDAERIKGLYDEGLASKKEYEDIQLQVSNAQKDVANAEQALSLIEEGATEEQKKQASAGVQEAEAGKEQAEAGVGQSKAAKEQSKAAKEQAIASKGQAVAAKDQAIAAKDQAVAAKGQAEAVYEQAVIGKEQAELTLSKTKLKSPISGVVLDKLVSEGQHVNAGDAIYKLGQTDQLKVLLPVPDREIKEWKVGDKVSVALYDKKKTGKVTKIYPQTNANTGTISVEVVISNENLKWVPGQVVKANRVTSDNNGILVPIEAVISNGAEPYVFKEVKGKAVKTPVTTGNLVDNKIHIVSGLKEDDRVVVRGGELLLDGDPLKTSGGNKK